MENVENSDILELVDALQSVSLGIADTATSGLSFTPPDGALGQVGAGIGAGFALIGIGLAGAKFHSERQKLKAAAPPNNSLLRGVGGASPRTRDFMLERINKDFAGATASSVGSAVSAVSQVNTLGAVKNASSLSTTAVHISKLTAMRKRLPMGSRTRTMLKIVLEAKRIKAGARTGALAADVIPSAIPAAGTIIGAGTAVATKIMNLRKESQWLLAAQILHGTAYYGLKRKNNLQNPAYRIARELLTQRGLSAVGKALSIPGFGKKRAKTAVYMKEPAGWLVLLDKIQAL